MVIVAVLLLPCLGLLLFTMAFLEDRLFDETGPARHGRRRHLRPVPAGGRGRHAAAEAGREERDAA